MATNTYTALYTTTVSGTSTNSITFSSIPSTYTDLVIVSSFQHSTDGACYVRVNSDSGSNYSRTSVTGDGSSAGSERASNQTYSRIAQTGANVDNLTITQFMNYSNATTYKTFLNRWNRPSAYVFADVNLWRSTSAISSIEISHSNGGYFTAGSTFAVYGIAAASSAQGTAKATGGTITYDAYGNVIHTFTSSGTFTPSVPLTCEYLVVAGGGGGGIDRGGGGGGGGLLTSSVALPASAISITVGAGGAASGNNWVYPGANGSDSSISSFVTAIGGGGGNSGFTGVNGITGGSGGGGTSQSNLSLGGAGTTGQGNRGGNGQYLSTSAGGGGGGGAGARGGDANTSTGGNGGIGLISTLGGSGAYYAGGGGGGSSGSAGGTGGAGGGGNGVTGNGSATPTNGTANTGGGAGGGTGGAAPNSASGGSGIVIIRYPG